MTDAIYDSGPLPDDDLEGVLNRREEVALPRNSPLRATLSPERAAAIAKRDATTRAARAERIATSRHALRLLGLGEFDPEQHATLNRCPTCGAVTQR